MYSTLKMQQAPLQGIKERVVHLKYLNKKLTQKKIFW